MGNSIINEKNSSNGRPSLSLNESKYEKNEKGRCC